MKCKNCGSKHIHQVSQETIETCLICNEQRRCNTDIYWDSEYQDYICQECERYLTRKEMEDV